MLVLNIYLIGCFIAFILTFFMKKEEVEYRKKYYREDTTNGEWIFIVLGMTIMSWIIVLVFIGTVLTDYFKNKKFIIKINNWLHKKIVYE